MKQTSWHATNTQTLESLVHTVILEKWPWMQLIHVLRTALDATDTRPSDTLGCNWYTFLDRRTQLIHSLIFKGRTNFYISYFFVFLQITIARSRQMMGCSSRVVRHLRPASKGKWQLHPKNLLLSRSPSRSPSPPQWKFYCLSCNTTLLGLKLWAF
jgi:hypothetical protein